ncbi:MAG: hypothetical protein AAF919_06300 [Pseudomonadota bacterium]
MWGPLTRLRRWVRPLPTVGWAFRYRRTYGTVEASPAYALPYRSIWPSGVERDVLVPDIQRESATGQAQEIARQVLGSEVELIVAREVDRRDVPDDFEDALIGPPKHFGLVPLMGFWH